MPDDRTLSMDVATARGRAIASRHTTRRTRPWIAALLAAGLALPGPAGAAGDPVAGDPVVEGTAPPGVVGRVTGAPDPAPPGQEASVPDPLGRADGVLPLHRAGRAGRAVAAMPGCVDTATLDGVSAALQAGPFGRDRGLAIMQFRNVVAGPAQDGGVTCRADVLLSDGSLHHAEYALRQAPGGTRVHIEVAPGRLDAVPPVADATGPLPAGAAAPGNVTLARDDGTTSPCARPAPAPLSWSSETC